MFCDLVIDFSKSNVCFPFKRICFIVRSNFWVHKSEFPCFNSYILENAFHTDVHFCTNNIGMAPVTVDPTNNFNIVGCCT